MSDWANILDRLGAVRNAGANEEDIARFERSAGVALTAEFRSLLQMADGAELDIPPVRLLSLSEMGTYVPILAEHERGNLTRYVAFTESNDSNPFCLCTAGPLDGYVVRVHHDDYTEVAFRTFRGFFAALERLAVAGRESDVSIDELEFAIGSDRATRMQEDERRAEDLIRAADASPADSEEREGLLRLAFQLLPSSAADRVAGYLEAGDLFVRLAARETLEAIGTGEARQALRDDDAAMAAHTKAVTEALQAAGVTVTAAKEGVVSVRRKGLTGMLRSPIHFDLNAGFRERQEPDAMKRLVSRMTGEIAGRWWQA